MFAAAMHGIELCFLLMGEFVRDARIYVLKRPRIELLARDVISQCALLSEVRPATTCAPVGCRCLSTARAPLAEPSCLQFVPPFKKLPALWHYDFDASLYDVSRPSQCALVR
jgi:hypothetical protein